MKLSTALKCVTALLTVGLIGTAQSLPERWTVLDDICSVCISVGMGWLYLGDFYRALDDRDYLRKEAEATAARRRSEH